MSSDERRRTERTEVLRDAQQHPEHSPPNEDTEAQPITVLLADDHPSVRAGLRLLLQSAEGIEVIGEAADGGAAVRQVAELAPDVVLMDARMPGTDGIEATRRIVQATAGASAEAHGPGRPPCTEVLMLTTFDLDEVVFGALRAGAAGFLLKSVEPARLIEAIRQVAAGDGVVAPEVTRRLLDAFADDPAQPAAPPGSPSAGPATLQTPSSPVRTAEELAAQLTPRQLDVLAALGRGLSNAEIAEELFISLATVKTHVSSVLSGLHLTSRMQAAICAREAGLAA